MTGRARATVRLFGNRRIQNECLAHVRSGEGFGRESVLELEGGEGRESADDDDAPDEDRSRPGAHEVARRHPVEPGLAQARRIVRMKRRLTACFLARAFVPEDLERARDLCRS